MSTITTTVLTPDQLRKLEEFAAIRELQAKEGNWNEVKQTMADVFTWLKMSRLPRALSEALG